jgi:hypothetical protein
MVPTFNKRAELTRDAKTMYKVADNNDDHLDDFECHRKDFGPKRMIEDQEHVRKCISLCKVYKQFERTSQEL